MRLVNLDYFNPLNRVIIIVTRLGGINLNINEEDFNPLNRVIIIVTRPTKADHIGVVTHFNPLNRVIIIVTFIHDVWGFFYELFQSPKSGHYHCYRKYPLLLTGGFSDFNPLNRVIIIVTPLRCAVVDQLAKNFNPLNRVIIIVTTFKGNLETGKLVIFQSPKSGHYHCYELEGAIPLSDLPFQSPKSGHYHCYKTLDDAFFYVFRNFNPLNRVIIIVTQCNAFGR